MIGQNSLVWFLFKVGASFFFLHVQIHLIMLFIIEASASSTTVQSADLDPGPLGSAAYHYISIRISNLEAT